MAATQRWPLYPPSVNSLQGPRPPPPFGAAERALVASGGRTETVTVMVDGRARTVIAYVPAGVGSREMPLVFNLHGSGATAADQRQASGMDRAADAHGFIAAYPQAAIALGAGFAWNVRGQPLAGGAPVPPDAADDTAFIAAAIVAIERRQAVDHQRIYAAGMSGGGRMTSQLACELSTALAAVAPVAGLRFPEPCPRQRAVPIVAFHGTADR